MYFLGKWIFGQMFSYTSTKSWRSYIFIAVCVCVCVCLSVSQQKSCKPMQWCTVSVMSILKRYTLLERLLGEMCHSLGLPPFWWRISLDIHVLWGFYLMQTGRTSPTPFWPFAVYFLHLHEIMERLCLIFLAVCLCECLPVSQQNSSRMEAPI